MEPTGSTQGSASTCSEWEMHIPTPSPCSRLWLVGPPGAGVTTADVTGLAVSVVLPVTRVGSLWSFPSHSRQEAPCRP